MRVTNAKYCFERNYPNSCARRLVYCQIFHRMDEPSKLEIYPNRERFHCCCCNKTFDSRLKRLSHVKSHHHLTKSQKKIQCDLCSQGFCGRKRRINHMMKMHSDAKIFGQKNMLSSKNEIDEINIKQEANDTETELFQGRNKVQIDDSFTMEFEIKEEPKHVKKEPSESTINDEIQSKIIKPKSIVVTNPYEPKKIINKVKKTFDCTECPEKFEIEDELNEHIDIFGHMPTIKRRRTPTGKCPHCVMEYPGKKGLEAHIRRMHESADSASSGMITIRPKSKWPWMTQSSTSTTRSVRNRNGNALKICNTYLITRLEITNTFRT